MTTAQSPADQYRGRLVDAVRTIDRLQDRLENSRDGWLGEPVALTGIGCRFPGGADDPESFWQLLRNGVDAITEFPAERADAAAFYDPDPDAAGKTYTISGGFLDRIDQFEPEIFGISPREAVGMDPQHRILLEVAWEALERSGYAPDSLSGSRTGVFLGLSTTDYVRLRQQVGDIDDVDAYQLIGEPSFLAGRLSYTLGLRGPSKVIDTACSSSLVAVHDACQALRSRECDLALAGGVNLMLAPYGFVLMSKFRALAVDGRCKTFDAAADGYGRGEGAGVVTLKRLADAIADRDTILAVIRGSASNHDGSSSGLTVPNPQAQQEVIRAALAQARIDPELVDYVEAHGTGTSLGDPIELRALQEIMGSRRADGDPLLVGSVKTNIGHLEPASGIAGLIKVVLAMQHGEIPPHLHFSQPNPNIDWDRLNIEVTGALRDWPRRDRPMIAAVSSFGASGTNAHAVLTAPPSPPARPEPAEAETPGLVVLSARTPEALTELAGRYARQLSREEELNFADVCYTTQVGRARLAQGLGVVAAGTDDLVEALGQYARGAPDKRVVTATLPPYRQRKTAWLFTGQGAQYAGMAAGLRGEPVFDEAFAQVAALLDPNLGQPLNEVLWPEDGQTSPIDDTQYTQPALFALQYALAELWQSWGARPAALAGHSIGEISAAVVAGVMSLTDGAALVSARSRLMSALPPGGVMVAVSCDESTALAAAKPHASTVSVAAVNGPAATVLSGRAEDVETIVAELKRGGTKATRLTVSHAFHSPQMQPMVAEFAQLLSGMTFRAPDIPLVSNLTGRLWTEEEVGPDYWSRHVLGTVRFADGMRTLSDQGIRTFLEVGPGPVLCALGTRCLDDPDTMFTPSLRRGSADRAVLLRAVATVHLRGTNVDWAAVRRGAEPRRVPLPTTPWRGASYWFREAEPPAGQAFAATARDGSAEPVSPAAGGLGSSARRLHSAIPTYEVSLDPAHVEWIQDDAEGRCHIPMGTLVDLTMAAAHDSLGGQWNMVEEVVLHEPLYTSDSEPRTVHLTVINYADEGHALCEYHSISAVETAAGAPWTLHARGVLRRRVRAPQLADSATSPINTTMYHRALQVEQGAVPSTLAGVLDRAEQGDDGVLVALNDGWGTGWAVLIDAAVAAVRWAAHPEALGPSPAAVARRIAEMSCIDPGRIRYVRGTAQRAGAHDVDGTAEFFTENGEPLGGILELHVMDPSSAPARAAPWRDVGELLYDLSWQPLDAPAEPAGPGADHAGADYAGQGWLLIADRQGVAERCAEALSQAGAQVVTALPQVTGTARQCVPDLAAVRDAVADWRSAADRPERVVLFTGLDAPQLDHADAWSLEESVARADLMAAALVRELQDQLPEARLCLVTRGAVATSADQSVSNPVAGTLWGLGRVIALEHPDQWGGAVDLDPAGPPEEAGVLLAAWARSGAEDQQALRESGTLVARLTKRPAGPGELAREAVVRADGTYLITGAFGGIGKALCEWLARAGAGRLVLLARTELPDRLSWDEDLPAQVRAGVDLVRALERQGIEVEAMPCDVADEKQMADALTAIAKHPFPLRGVIHAAGVSHPQLIRDIDPDDFRKVWRPKVVGGWLIHQLTQTAELDFFLCFSSIAATWGSQHLGSYASANAFLDGLAQNRHAAGLPALTVSWGPWDLQSSLYGTEVMDFLKSTGLQVLSTPQSIGLLSAMLADECPVRVVCAADWARYKGVMEARIERPVMRAIEVSDDRAGEQESGLYDELVAARSGPDSRQAQRKLILGFLRGILGEVLGIDGAAVDEDTDVVGFGLDSLMAMDVVGKCKRVARVNVTASDLFGQPTLGEWATLITAELASEPGGDGPPSEPGGDGPPSEAAGDGAASAPEGDQPAAASSPAAGDISDPAVIAAHVTLDPAIVPGAARKGNPREPAEILLTGATGFVGGYLLDQLLEQTTARIQLLVRCDDPADGLLKVRRNVERYLPWRPEAQARLRVIPGDLGRPLLGLEQEEFEALADSLDAIHHAGAWVNFSYGFEQLRPVNLDGTAEILRLACHGRQTPVHYVSTYGIWGVPPAGHDVIREDDDIVAAGRLVTGYVQTKWAAELLVGQARERGVPVAVYRPGRVLGDSRTGACLTTHFTTRVLKGCVQLGMAPLLDIDIEMTPVDYVTAAQVAISVGATGRDGTYHLVNPVKMGFNDLMEVLRERGWPLAAVPVDRWWAELKDSYGERPNELHTVMDVVEEFIVGGEEAIHYDVTAAADALSGTGISCPPLDTQLLNTYLDWLLAADYLPALAGDGARPRGPGATLHGKDS